MLQIFRENTKEYAAHDVKGLDYLNKKEKRWIQRNKIANIVLKIRFWIEYLLLFFCLGFKSECSFYRSLYIFKEQNKD